MAEVNQILQDFEVNWEQEAALMMRYIKVFSRELVFAVDLTAFVIKLSYPHLQSCIYRHCFGVRGAYDFDYRMKRFVQLILEQQVKAAATRAMEDNLKLELVTYKEFKSFVNASAFGHEAAPFGDATGPMLGSGAYAYLVFCVMMAEMCTIAYQHGMPKAPHFGIMLMCRTFSNLRLRRSAFPPNPWDELKFVANDLVVVLEITARTPP